MTVYETLDVTGSPSPKTFTSPVTTPRFQLYKHMSLSNVTIARSSTPSQYGVRVAKLSSHRLTPGPGLLESMARIMWPVATFHWIKKVLHLSDALLEYVDEPPGILAVINAGKELQKLTIYQLLPKCVSAMGDGGICLAWPLEGFYAGLSCYNDGDITLNYRVRGGESIRVASPSPQDLSAFAAAMRKYN